MIRTFAAPFRRLRSDGGFTLAEMGVASMLGMAVLTMATALLIAVSNAGMFTQSQGFTINDARNAMQQIEKEVRSADAIGWCAADGSCLEVATMTPTGDTRTVRYEQVDGALNRQVYDPTTSTWGGPQTVVERVANTDANPVFSCEESTSALAHVSVDLEIEPTPRSDPTLNVNTSIRPRNFSAAATCPGA